MRIFLKMGLIRENGRLEDNRLALLGGWNWGKGLLFGSVLLGSQFLVTPGQCQEFQLQTLTMETQTGTNLGSNSANVGMSEFFKAQKQAVYHILRHAGVDREDLPADIRSAIEEPQTTSYKAMEAFSKGLDQMDKEQFDSAKEFFEQAVQLDPKFELASTLREAMPEVNQTIQGSVNKAMDKAQTKAAAIVGKAEESSEAEADSDAGATEGDAASEEGDAASEEGESASEEGSDSGEAESGSSDDGLATGGGEGESTESGGSVEVSGTVIVATNEVVLPASIAVDIDEVQTVASQSSLVDVVPQATEFKLNQIESGAGEGGYLKIYSSKSPSSRLGMYVIQLLKKQGDDWAEIVEDSYMGSGKIPEDGLVVLDDPETKEVDEAVVGRVTALKDHTTDFEDTDLKNTLSRHLNENIEITDGELETGFYSVLPASMGVDPSCTDCQYYYGDRTFFVEGTPTSVGTLAELASQNAEYVYTGSAGSVMVDIEHRTDSNSGTFESTDTGTFGAIVNFGSKEVKDVNIDALTDSYAVKVQGGTADLQSDGSFNFAQSGTVFQVGTRADVLNGQATATSGQLNGQIFDSEAKNVGGVLSIQRNVGDNEKWQASGNFRGSR